MQYIVYDKMLRIMGIINFNKFKPKLNATESMSQPSSSDIKRYIYILVGGRYGMHPRFVSEIETLPTAITYSCDGIMNSDDIIQYAINPKQKGRLYDLDKVDEFVKLFKDHPKFIVGRAIDIAVVVSRHMSNVRDNNDIKTSTILEEIIIQQIDIKDSVGSFFTNLCDTENLSLILPSLAALTPTELSDIMKNAAIHSRTYRLENDEKSGISRMNRGNRNG